MVRTRSSATKAVAAKAPRKLNVSTKSGRVAKRGRSSKALPPITPQPTPAWQKTIDTFLPKSENNENPGGSTDVQGTGACEIVTGSDSDMTDKEIGESCSGLGACTSGLKTGSDNEQQKEIAEVNSNGADKNNVCKETIGLENVKDEKEATSEIVESESEKVLNN